MTTNEALIAEARGETLQKGPDLELRLAAALEATTAERDRLHSIIERAKSAWETGRGSVHGILSEADTAPREDKWEYECRTPSTGEWRACVNPNCVCERRRRLRYAPGPWLPVEGGSHE